MTGGVLAKRLGRSRADMVNTIRLLDLPDEAIELIDTGQLSKGHGKALLTELDHHRRRQLARLAAERRWSVRQLETEINRPTKPPPRRHEPEPDHCAAATLLQDAPVSATGCEGPRHAAQRRVPDHSRPSRRDDPPPPPRWQHRETVIPRNEGRLLGVLRGTPERPTCEAAANGQGGIGRKRGDGVGGLSGHEMRGRLGLLLRRLPTVRTTAFPFRLWGRDRPCRFGHPDVRIAHIGDADAGGGRRYRAGLPRT